MTPKEPRKRRLLFVCYGNICRSPMAEGIARLRLDGRAEAASAGIGATGGPASEEAVRVMKIVYKIDISAHVARPVGTYDLGSFDFIVALDPSIYHHLRDIWGVPESVLYGWNIADPLGGDYQTYKAAARAIEQRLDQFLAAVGLAA